MKFLRPLSRIWSSSNIVQYMLNKQEYTTTTVNFPQSQYILNHSSVIVSIGSCFSENISCELIKRKFVVEVNPYGILFNPYSISTCIHDVIQLKTYTEDDLFQDLTHPDIFHSWNHHSSFSNTQSKKLIILNSINNRIRSAHDNLQHATVLIITLGSSFVHRLISTNEIVANCHKQPSKLFTKELLSIQDIYTSLKSSILLCRSINPTLKVILTVSPVRHTKEGIVENTVSKAHLIASVHMLVNDIDLNKRKGSIQYFPSFEYMIDELRDYRWYEDDMIHPSKLAIQYIYNKFINSYMDTNTLSLIKEIDSINSNLSHRPLLATSIAYQKHIQSTITKIETFQQKYTPVFPNVHFQSELEILRNMQTT